jgi:hypothetical protein
VIVENLIVPLRLAAVTIGRVVQALGRGELEVHRLPGERPQSRGDEEQPGQQLRPILGRAQKLAGLFRQIDQDGGRVEDPVLISTQK